MTGSPTLRPRAAPKPCAEVRPWRSPSTGGEGFVRRPNLLGAMVVKAAAHGNPGDPDQRRHRRDFVVLAGLISASDFAGEDLTKKDRQRLRSIVSGVIADLLLLEIPDATAAIDRLRVAANLDS